MFYSREDGRGGEFFKEPRKRKAEKGAGEREDVATGAGGGGEDGAGGTESMIRNPRAEKHHKTKNEFGDRLGIW